MTPHQHTDRTGLAAGVAAYLLWGLFPLYWPLLLPAGPLEILAHRIVWSFVLVTIALTLLRVRWTWLAEVVGRRFGWLLAAATLIGINWLTYIFSVNSGHIVEGSLGYFINPLVNVVLGALVFGERLGRGGIIGGLLALVGVTVIAWSSWQTLWISLLLAFSFGLYGVTKKKTRLGALQGLFVESAFLTLPSLAYLLWLGWTGVGQFGSAPLPTLLLVLAGPLTTLPLWLYSVAAGRLPLGVVGILQYIAPTMQLLFALFVFGQHISLAWWIGLTLVWIGSIVYLNTALRPPRPTAA